MEYVVAIGLYIILLSVAGIFGLRCLRKFVDVSSLHSAEVIVFSFALGFAFLSFLVLFLGLAHALSIPWLILCILPGVVYSLRGAGLFFRALRVLAVTARELCVRPLHRIMFLCIALSVAVTFLAALAPAKGNDALVYHLADAKFFAQNHLVTFIPYTARSLWPYFVQMLFTLALLFKSVLLAKLFHFTFAIGSAFAVYAFARRFFNRDAAFIAITSFLLTPGIMSQATYAYIDLGWTFYTFLGVYAFLLWDATKKRSWLALSALFCGIAADTKYLGLVTPGIMGLMVLVENIRGHKGKKGVVDLVLFSGVVVIMLLPYYLRAYLVTGNPLYPFYIKYIGETGWYQSPAAFGMTKTLLNFLLSPWFVTVYPGRIFAGGESQLGPLFLALLPALIFLKKKGAVVWRMIIFSAGFYCFWFFCFPAMRFLQPLVPFFSVLAGCVVASFLRDERGLARAIKWIFLAFLSINFALCLYYHREEVAFFAQGAHKAAYLARHNRTGEIYQFINEHTPRDAKIFIVNELRIFHLDRPSMREVFYRVYDKYYEWTPDTIVADLRKKGITHILYAHTPRQATVDRRIVGGLRPGATVNRFDELMQDGQFLRWYLLPMRAVLYTADESQKTKYVLYQLR